MTKEMTIQEDEIDLKELFKTLAKNKMFIFVFTGVVTVISIIYSISITPTYEVKAIIEVGSNSNSNSNSWIENPNNLVQKLDILYKQNANKDEKDSFESASLVKGTENLVEIVVHSQSNENATKKIKSIVDGIILEHKEKIENYKKMIGTNIDNLKTQKTNLEQESKLDANLIAMKYGLSTKINDLELQLSSYNIKETKLIGNIITNEHPIKPKKKLIVTVAFVTGLILSVFLVFFIEFIKGMKEENK